MKVLKVYLDNVIASAITKRDLCPVEMQAVDRLLLARKQGKIVISSSRWSLREMERTRDPNVREELKRAFRDLEVVQHDHILLGFDNQYGQYGGCSNPLVTDVIDEAVLASLTKMGLGGMDARHFHGRFLQWVRLFCHHRP